MARQSISLSEPNDSWLKDQVAAQEFSSKSEAVNYLIRKEREKEKLRALLVSAESSGLLKVDKDSLLKQIKDELKGNENL